MNIEQIIVPTNSNIWTKLKFDKILSLSDLKEDLEKYIQIFKDFRSPEVISQLNLEVSPDTYYAMLLQAWQDLSPAFPIPFACQLQTFLLLENNIYADFPRASFFYFIVLEGNPQFHFLQKSHTVALSPGNLLAIPSGVLFEPTVDALSSKILLGVFK